MFIINLLGVAFIFGVMSAINAVAMHIAAGFAEADYPDYKETFLNIFYGYMIFVLLIFILQGLGMINNFFLAIAWFSVIAWVIYRLVHKLGVEGSKNIIIFIGMSFFFNMITCMLIRSFF